MVGEKGRWMEHYRAGGRPTRSASDAYFTGTVFQDPIVQTPAPARLQAVRVTFLPGSRTNWHTHPLGQTLYVVSGVGRFQTDGQGLIEIGAGDTVWIPPGERHWHGAGLETAMCHIAMQEGLDGVYADWQEPVSEADYGRQP